LHVAAHACKFENDFDQQNVESLPERILTAVKIFSIRCVDLIRLIGIVSDLFRSSIVCWLYFAISAMQILKTVQQIERYTNNIVQKALK